MKIRKAGQEDIPDIMSIYKYARKQMKKSGNPTQWGDNYPPLEQVQEDLSKGALFVLEDMRQCGCSRKPSVVGAFAFYIGEDPTYGVIEDGQWLNEEEYGTIHRIAGGPATKNIVGSTLEYVEKLTGNIRIDTHNDNKPMQHVLKKNGFVRCGTIYVEDGSPRVAFQKKCK